MTRWPSGRRLRSSGNVNAWAISILTSRTFQLNAVAVVVAVLSLSEFVQLIPARLMPLYSLLMGIINIFLRTQTTRPVAFIKPGATKVVEIPKIDPPAPGMATD